MDLWAVIFNIWRDEPIYHKLAAPGTWATQCGRKIGLHTPLLPMKHVKRFSRPCRSCYPQEG